MWDRSRCSLWDSKSLRTMRCLVYAETSSITAEELAWSQNTLSRASFTSKFLYMTGVAQFSKFRDTSRQTCAVLSSMSHS